MPGEPHGSEETVDTLKERILEKFEERDLRYEQRWDAQQRAVDIALKHVDKEFHEHLVAVREETRLSLSAAEKAITKAEAATEKRFDAVNEFRGQLTDQAATFISRVEADAKLNALSDRFDAYNTNILDKIEAINKTFDSRFTTMAVNFDNRLSAMVSSIAALASRIDRNDGRTTGLGDGGKLLVATAGLILTILSVIATIVALTR